MQHAWVIGRFDLKQDIYPGHDRFNETAASARKYIHRFSDDQLAQLVGLLDSIMRHIAEIDPEAHAFIALDHPKAPRMASQAQALDMHLNTIKVEDLQPGLPEDLQWPDMFAVLALALLGRAYCALQGIFPAPAQDDPEDYDSLSAFALGKPPEDYIHDALEALAIADRIALKQQWDDQSRQQRVQAAKQRQQKKYGAIKQAFFAYAEQHPGLSMSQTAKRFYESCQASNQNLLKALSPEPYQARRTLAGWLSKRRKAHKPFP